MRKSKRILVTVLLALVSLAWVFPAAAAQAIYKTAGSQVIYGNGRITRIAATGFWVFDPDTGRLTAIGAFTLNGSKIFSVVPAENYRIERVTGAAGATYTIIAKAESPGTQFAGTLLESAYSRGLDSSVTIDSQGLRRLPRTFASVGRAIIRNEQTGVTVTGETTGSALLDVNASKATNLSESFDDAVARLTIYFIARGFTQFSPAPAQP